MHQTFSGGNGSNNDRYTFRYDLLFQKDMCRTATPFFDGIGRRLSSKEAGKQQQQPSVPSNFTGNNPLYSSRSDILKFSSQFESGNLDLAIKVEGSVDEYDLFMRVDSNTRGHFQWYYFSIEGGVKGSTVKLNICNFYKKKSLY